MPYSISEFWVWDLAQALIQLDANVSSVREASTQVLESVLLTWQTWMDFQ